MTPTERLAMIETGLASGKTVYIQSYTKVWKVTPKVAKGWADAGYKLFKASEKSLYIARGKSFDDISLCGITVRS